MARGQKSACIFGSVPHMFRRRDHPRQTFHTRAFMWLQLVAPAMESGRRHDPQHQRRGIRRFAVNVPGNLPKRSPGQPGFNLSFQLLDRIDLAAQTQYLGNLARFNQTCVHTGNSQLISAILSSGDDGGAPDSRLLDPRSAQLPPAQIPGTRCGPSAAPRKRAARRSCC